MLNLRKGTNQDELDRFFEVMTDQAIVQGVTQSALWQARHKLNPDALPALNRVLLREFGDHFAPRLWQGFRLLGVDGSTGRLPDNADIRKTFGDAPERASVAMARLSRLYDVLNGLVIEADIEQLSSGKRVLAGEHLLATAPNDLLLYDRGYPAFWLFAYDYQEQRHFCARLPNNFCTEAEIFLNSEPRSAVVTLSPGREARKQCEAYGLPTDPIRVRLIKVKLNTGEIKLLATSLLDEQAYPSPWFKRLYFLHDPEAGKLLLRHADVEHAFLAWEVLQPAPSSLRCPRSKCTISMPSRLSKR